MTAKKRPKAAPRRGLGPAYAAVLLSMSFAAYGQLRAQLLAAKPEKAASSASSPAQGLVRGLILGADGEILARSRSVYEFGIDPSKAVLAPGFLAQAAAISGLPAGELEGYGTAEQKTRLWLTPMTRSQVQQLKGVAGKWRTDGVWVRPVSDRAVSSGEPLGGIIGTVIEEDGAAKGLVALEREFEGFLEGGLTLPAKLAGASAEIRATVAKADPGLERSRSIQLTIRPRLQEAAYEAIRAAAVQSKAHRAAAVVLDPKTGDLLALANWPSYDPSGRAKDGADFNAAVSGLYEPGSTLKLLTLGQALQAGTLQPGQKLQSVSRYMVDKFNSVGNSVGGFGMIDEREAIARSCNTSAAQWALALGQDRLFRFYSKIGITRPTRLGLGQEPGGLMKKDRGAPRLQTANIGFGQSINCTPLQLAAAFGMLANGGELMEPRLVARAGGVELGTESRGRFLRPEVCRHVLSAAEDVITQSYGTGRSLAVPGLRMAGKTGTAQKLGSGRAKDRDQYVSSFVGFAPMPKPQYVVLVMVDDPREGHYGAQVAGPAYRRIIEAMLDQGLLEADPERYNAADEPEPERDPEPKRPQAD